MVKFLRKLSDKGASLTEYALLVSLIAVICLVAVSATGGNIQALMGQTAMATSNLTVTTNGAALTPTTGPGGTTIPVGFVVGSTLTAQITLAEADTIPFTAECIGDNGDTGKQTETLTTNIGDTHTINVPVAEGTTETYLCTVNGIAMNGPGASLASGNSITYPTMDFTSTTDSITATFTATPEAINGYVLRCDDGISPSAAFSPVTATSPITVNSLIAGTEYLCTVLAESPDDSGTPIPTAVNTQSAPLTFSSASTDGNSSQDVITYTNGNFYQTGASSTNGKYLQVSTDGTSWVTQNTGLAQTVSGIGSIGGNEIIISDGSSSPFYRYRSSDTASWNNAYPTGSPSPPKAIACSSTECLIMSRNETDNVKVTFAGSTPTWTTQGGSPSASWTALAYGNGAYVVTDGSSTKITTDAGATWSNTTGSSGGLADITYNNGKFYGVQTGGWVSESTDGNTWSSIGQIGLGRSGARKIAVSDTGILMVVTTNDQYVDEVEVSYDGGATWSDIALPARLKWHGIAYGEGRFVVTNGTNAAYTN